MKTTKLKKNIAKMFLPSHEVVFQISVDIEVYEKSVMETCFMYLLVFRQDGAGHVDTEDQTFSTWNLKKI